MKRDKTQENARFWDTRFNTHEYQTYRQRKGGTVLLSIYLQEMERSAELKR